MAFRERALAFEFQIWLHQNPDATRSIARRRRPQRQRERLMELDNRYQVCSHIPYKCAGHAYDLLERDPEAGLIHC